MRDDHRSKGSLVGVDKVIGSDMFWDGSIWVVHFAWGRLDSLLVRFATKAVVDL
jgi:hypothetical protein